jgi:hypothetical protein
MSAALYIYESRSLLGCIAAGRSFSRSRNSRSETMNYVKTQRKLTERFWKNHQWFVQAFDSGIMDHNFTVKSDLIGGIASFTDHGLLLSSDVTQVVAAIGAILATAMAYVQRIGATLLLGISLGFRSDRFPSRRLFRYRHEASEYGSL